MASYLKTIDGQTIRLGQVWSPIECFRCGICCIRYQPKLTVKEVETLAEHLSLPIRVFFSRYVQKTPIGYLLRRRKTGCIFLVWEEGGTRASCAIYPFRPEACRNWTPSLSRPECQEGLAKLKARNRIMLVNELYSSSEAINTLCSSLNSMKVEE